MILLFDVAIKCVLLKYPKVIANRNNRKKSNSLQLKLLLPDEMKNWIVWEEDLKVQCTFFCATFRENIAIMFS